jgi:23S rRNA pseudouridine2457 synthase
LLLLSDEARFNEMLLHPHRRHPRVYWAQVERVPSADSLRRLSQGLPVQGFPTLPCHAWIPDPEPIVPPRDPPVRDRKSVPTCWLALQLVEGRNRQVRRMTAAIGHPTLRLIRVQIGRFRMADLAPGTWRLLDEDEQAQVCSFQERQR